MMTLRNSVCLAMVAAGVVGLLASRGKPVTLRSGFITIPAGLDSSTHAIYLTIPAGTFIFIIAIGLVMLFWPRERKLDA